MTWENHYCGPYALARVAGITVEEATRRLRAVTGKSRIFGVHDEHLQACLETDPGVLQFYDFKTVVLGVKPKKPTVEAFAAQFDDGSSYWVMSIASHFFVLRRGKVFQNSRTEITPLKQYVRRTAYVRRAWKCK